MELASLALKEPFWGTPKPRKHLTWFTMDFEHAEE